MIITEIKEKDLNRLAELYVEAFNAEPWNDEWTIEIAKKRLRNMIGDSGFYGIKLEDGDICSFILGHEEVFYNGTMFNIKEFCTNKKFQGRGYGEMLILDLEKRLAKKGIKEIILMTTKSEKAEGFYSKRGYETYNKLVMMGKELKEEDK